MPGLDLSQVSSNWKKLQEKLQSEKKTKPVENGLKRKRLEDKRPASGLKKAKLSDGRPKQLLKSRQMGQTGSRNGDSKHPDDAHMKLAKEHNIPQKDISAAYNTTSTTTPRKQTDEINGGLHPTHKIGKYISMDCEMVGTGPPPHDDNVLARVSLVNFHGEQIYDSYVLPPPKVTVEDYRTFVSGIKPIHLKPGFARALPKVQEDVARLLDGRILVGHALQNDLQALLLSHPKRNLRDTSRYPKFRIANRGRPPALRKLAKSELGLEIQAGEHSSIEDARAAMMLFVKEKEGFEEENRKRFGVRGKVEVKVGKAGGADYEDGSQEVDGRESEDDMELLDGEDDDFSANEDAATSKAPPATGMKKRKKKKRTKRK